MPEMVMVIPKSSLDRLCSKKSSPNARSTITISVFPNDPCLGFRLVGLLRFVSILAFDPCDLWWPAWLRNLYLPGLLLLCSGPLNTFRASMSRSSSLLDRSMV